MTALEAPSDFITVEKYLADEEIRDTKHEYDGGTVHPMTDFSNLHNRISGNSLGAFCSQLHGKRYKPFNSATKIRIKLPDHTRFYYPDAMVVENGNPDTDHFQDNPIIIVEVLNDTTRRRDLREKRDAYLAISTLKVLLFAEADTPSVLVHRRQPVGGFSTEQYTELDEVILLPEIEAELALAELYDRVEFAD